MKTLARTHELFRPQVLKQDQQGPRNSWSHYESTRPKNVHRRVDSDLVFACFSLLVLLLFAAADAAFRF